MAKALLNLVDVQVRRGMNTVLDGCSMVVHGGQTVVLTGSNGAGKSTLLETAAGLLPVERGHVQHGEIVIIDAEGRRRASPSTVAVVLQRNGMLGSEILSEHLQTAMSMTGQSVSIDPFLEAFKLTHRANDLVAHLSQGQNRKVAVLAGLLPAFASPSPALVIMDEPDAGLDDESIKTLGRWMDALRSAGHALVVATHDERIMRHATHLYDVGGGEWQTQSPADAGAVKPPKPRTVKPLSPAAFGIRMHLRTMMWLNANAMAGLLTLGILLSLGDFTSDLTPTQRMGFILAPALATGLCGEPLVAALREERAGAWWRAVSGKEPHAGWIPLAIGAAFTFLTTNGLQDAREIHVVGAGAVLCFLVWHSVGWTQRSTQRLARPHAVFVGLLTPVLILPYLILVDFLA